MTDRPRAGSSRCWCGPLAVVLLVGLAPAHVGAAPAMPDTSERSTDQCRVAVVGHASAELTMRLVAELRFLGLIPEVVDPPASPETLALSEAARRAGARAAVRVDEPAGRIEIWITDRTTGTLVVQSLATSDPEQPRDLAVRTAELLRALHAEMERAPPPRALDQRDDTIAPPSAPPPRPRFGIMAGIAVGDAPGGMPVVAYARAQLRHMPHPHVGVVLTGMATTLRATDVSGQDARLRIGGVAVGPRFVLRRPEAIVVPDLSVAIGATFVDLRSTMANQGTRTFEVDARVEGSAGLELRLSRRLRLRTELAGGVCTQTVRVRFSGHPVAAWCSPHALGMLGLGVVL